MTLAELVASGWARAADPLLAVALAGAIALYAVGLFRLWRHAGRGRGIGAGRAWAALGGFAALALALLSPLEALATLFFSAHMAQHLLLIFVAAPLLVLAAPWFVALWTLPIAWRRALARAANTRSARAVGTVAAHPVLALVAFTGILSLWHLPALFEAALRHPPAHALEHVSLLIAAGLFWQSLVGSLGHRRGRVGKDLGLLVAAFAHGGALGALITLAPRPWYPTYQDTTPHFGIPALVDQQLAGVLMWVPSAVVYVAVAAGVVYRGLRAIATYPTGTSPAPPASPPTS